MPRSESRRSRPPAPLRSLARLLVLLAIATGCSRAAYVAHVSAGQARLLWERERLDPAVIARLEPRERESLAAVERARAKAERIGLAPSSSYTHLVDRDGQPLITLVVAAPVDRVEPVTWWFPIVGRVPYRGYFDPEGAERFAHRLRDRGLDTYTRPALAYSTLGWFDDPLPRALLRLDRIDLTNTVIHERVHESVFVPGDLDYNEGIATFVAQRATLELLADDPEGADLARRRFADERRFGELIGRLAGELETLYQQTVDEPHARAAREELFQRYREEEFPAQGWETERYAGFSRAELSNAYVVAQRTYLGYLPCLERELAALDGDLVRLVARHRETPGRRPDPDRECAKRDAQ